MTSDPKSEKQESALDYRVRSYNGATEAFKKQHELAEKEKAKKLDQTGTAKV